MSRLLLLLALAVAALASAASTAGAASPRLTELASAEFPEQSYGLTLPAKRTITKKDVRVTENGEQVSGLTIRRSASEYVISYRSLAGPDEEVTVNVRVNGFERALVSGYRTPALAVPPVVPPYEPESSANIVGSTWVMILVSFLTTALGGLAIVLFVLPRRSTLRGRIGAFVSLAQPAALEQRRQRRDNRARLAAPDPHRPPATSRWGRLEEALEISRIDISATSLVVWTALGTVAMAWLLPTVSGLGASALLAFAVPLAVRAVVKMRLGRVRRKFADQLPDNLEVLASGLRAGHSLIGALSLVVADAPEPSKTEFSRVIGDEQLGIPLDSALVVVVGRMDSRDLDQVALVARLQRESGANSTEVLDRVVESIRDRQAVRRLVRTLTAQGRLSGGVLVALPIFMLIVLVLINREYITPLFTEPLGRVMLITCMAMIGLGWLAIRRIIDIKV